MHRLLLRFFAAVVFVSIAVVAAWSTAVAGSSDGELESSVGSVAFVGSLFAIGVIVAVVVWNVRRNRRW